MKHTLRVIPGLLLCVILLLCLAGTASAESASGTWGTNLSWTLDGNGLLTISGSGKMTRDYSGAYPWLAYKADIRSVVIEEGVTSIGTEAFSGCASLTEVSLPQVMSYIDSEVFEKCTSLTKITLPNGLTSTGVGLFTDCTNLETVNLPDSIKYIYTNTFRNCGALKNITLPPKLEIIDNYAFYACRSLTEITLPESVIDLRDDAFMNCSNLERVTLPQNLEEIGDSAFQGCKKLEELTLPQNLKVIGDSAFKSCTALSEIALPVGLTAIWGEAFAYTGLTEVTIPGSVEYMYTGVFKGCSTLTTVVIEQGVPVIYGKAFQDCSMLTDVTIPDTADYIFDAAFSGCTQLEEIRLPKNMMDIDENTFSGCTRLRSVVIPDPQDSFSISGSAFSGCTALSDIYCNVTESKWSSFDIRSAEIQAATLHCLHTISVPGVDGGMLRVLTDGSEVSTSMDDAVLRLEAQPLEGFELVSITCASAGEDDYLIEPENGVYTVVMPNANVVFTPLFQQISYLISVSAAENGRVNVSSNTATMNTFVQVSAVPDEGFILNTLQVKLGNSDIDVTAMDDGTYRFKMPAGNVTVTADFSPAYTAYTVSYDANGGSGAPAAQQKLDIADLALTDGLPVREGWYFLGWAKSAAAQRPEYWPGSAFAENGDTVLYAVWAQPDLVLPASLNVIGEEAFAAGACTFVMLPQQETEIGPYAFAGCGGLKAVCIPAGEADIDADAFGGVKSFTILAPADSAAALWAQDYGCAYCPLPAD